MSNNNSNSGGIGFIGLLAIVFIVLKFCDVIEWSWWWVTCPLWAPIAIFTVCYGVVYLWAAISVRFFSTTKQKQQMKHIREEEQRNAGKSKWQIRLEEMQKANELKQRR